MAGSVYWTAATSDLVKGYRKTATKLYVAFKKKTEEYEWVDDIPEEDVTFSAREMLIPLDVSSSYGAAMIPEAGYEAVTTTPALQEGTVAPVQMNQRFVVSLLAQAYDRKGRAGQIIRQVKYQSLKAVESMAFHFGVQTYGLSTGTVAQCNGGQGAATSHTITLKNLFGLTSLIGSANLSTNQQNYFSSLFRVGERVALIRASALVANAIGAITASSAGTITVSWDTGSVTINDADNIVYANAVIDATIAATNFNRTPVGFFDALTSSSVHGLATSTAPKWAAGFADTSGSRFSYVRLKKMRQGLYNNGGGTLTDVIWSNGVENDVEAGERAARIYTSASLDLDGSVKAKNVTFRTSALAVPGTVIGWDRDGYSKLLLTDKPAEDNLVDFGEMDKAEDRSALKASLNLIYARMVRNRGAMGYAASLTEQ